MRSVEANRQGRNGGLSAATISPPVWDREPYARIPPGRYQVQVVGFQGPEWVPSVRRNSLRLECAVIAEGVRVSIFFNFGGSPGKIGRPGTQSKYTKHWVMAAGRYPRKGEPMDWAIFVGRFFLAEIEDAATDSKGQEKGEAEIYSRISHFILLDDM